MGSAKWLSLRRHNRAENNTLDCIQRLRERGYRIVATTPNVESYSPRDLPLDKPTALLYGTEEIGLSDEALAQADANLKLPMYGFTQSYNISVTVAISLSALVERLRSSDIAWQLSPTEQDALRVQWQRRILKHSDELERRFEREWNENGARE
jgi:tRNA (guanosine-2'-O-)-methyltransferase